ncbi:MAG: type II toxin-antitoxin system VapC family toxin [Acidobacteria bacterium]|nr:type II toxin-antitoxin system VapC family toxin [Acidobacteriota bacterium]MYJ04527.1 type II toxin-antitoxin system VapC family toxin [Acidobacteriota bacterium]
MDVLLDTFYLYRFMATGDGLSDAERRFLDDHAARIFVSAVSIWEMRLKFQARDRAGARKSRFDPEDVIAALEQQDVTFLPMTVNHAARKLDVSIAHHDPFDEMLLLQAQKEGLRLLTTDRQLVAHPLTIAP